MVVDKWSFSEGVGFGILAAALLCIISGYFYGNLDFNLIIPLLFVGLLLLIGVFMERKNEKNEGEKKWDQENIG
jgi:hypothetical protein